MGNWHGVLVLATTVVNPCVGVRVLQIVVVVPEAVQHAARAIHSVLQALEAANDAVLRPLQQVCVPSTQAHGRHPHCAFIPWHHPIFSRWCQRRCCIQRNRATAYVLAHCLVFSF